MNIATLLPIIKTPLDRIFAFLEKEIKQIASNRFLEYQVEEYKRNFYSKTMIHRSEARGLDEYYQPLFIYRPSAPTQRIPTDSVKRLLDKWDYITIIGTAGSGKSTIVKYLFTNCFTEKYKIPIKVELRYINDYKGGLTDYIFNEIFGFHGLADDESIRARILSTGGFVFFFDGYDEINSAIRAKITKEIDSFTSRYHANKYVLTSRPFTNIEQLPLFVNFQVSDLSEIEIAEFVKKQIPISEKELAQKLIIAIKKEENGSYRSFLGNPLLLSMFILTFQSYSEIPQKRSEFYDQVFDTLFSIHDSVSKLAYVREKTSGLSKDQFEEVLQLFSFLSFFDEKFVFPRNYLTDTFNTIKEKKLGLKFDNDKLIEDLQIAIGMLNKEGLDYVFPHRSLQEYFSALYISKLSPNNKKVVYKKLLTSIENNFHSLLDQSHFYSLLVELDYNNLATQVAVPILGSLFSALQITKRITNSLAYEHYCKLLFLYHLLLNRAYLLRVGEEEILDKRIQIMLFGNRDGIFKLPKHLRAEDAAHIKIEIIKRKIKLFKSGGNEIINTLLQCVSATEQADSDIINLVQ